MRFLTDEPAQRARRANRRKADTPRARRSPFYRPAPVTPSKRVKQQIMREEGVTGKQARRLMKVRRRERKATEDRVFERPARPVPPHTPGMVS